MYGQVGQRHTRLAFLSVSIFRPPRRGVCTRLRQYISLPGKLQSAPRSIAGLPAGVVESAFLEGAYFITPAVSLIELFGIQVGTCSRAASDTAPTKPCTWHVSAIAIGIDAGSMAAESGVGASATSDTAPTV